MNAREMKALIAQVRETWPDNRSQRAMFYCDFAERAWPNRGQIVGVLANPRAIRHINQYSVWFMQVSRDDPRPSVIGDAHGDPTDQT